MACAPARLNPLQAQHNPAIIGIQDQAKCPPRHHTLTSCILDSKPAPRSSFFLTRLSRKKSMQGQSNKSRFHHTTVYTARITKHEEWTQGYLDQAGPGFSGLSLSLATCGFDHRGRNVRAWKPLPPGPRERPGVTFRSRVSLCAAFHRAGVELFVGL